MEHKITINTGSQQFSSLAVSIIAKCLAYEVGGKTANAVRNSNTNFSVVDWISLGFVTFVGYCY